jgi:hypothetical protein
MFILLSLRDVAGRERLSSYSDKGGDVMKNKILLLVVIAAITVLMASLGAAVVFADTPVNQGTLNACAKHAENNGNSFAKGLDCPIMPPPPPKV